MASLYITEPPTDGKILLVTNKGDIEIELWSKEAPKACRNIIALALEGYYDNCIFHRIVPGFCIQTGDPLGTGIGGESFYGQPFDNEPHQRLKFNKRGMVAMANDGEPTTNESQFFITLDATPELHGKYTIFGRVAGQTIFNALAISEVELSKEEPDRPIYPPKLLRVDVLHNPFDDIVPRITREEKQEQQRAKKQAANRKQKEKETKKTKKNTALLSFGQAEETEVSDIFKGPKSSHDLLQDKKLSKKTISLAEEEPENPISSSSQVPLKKSDQNPVAVVSLSELTSSVSSDSKASEQDKISTLESVIHNISKSSSSSSIEKSKSKMGKELLQQVRAKYLATSATTISSPSSSSSSRNKKSSSSSSSSQKQDTTLNLLVQFQNRIRDQSRSSIISSSSNQKDTDQDDEFDHAREYGSEQDDKDWRNHRLDAGGAPLIGKHDQFKVEDYEVLDPRKDSQQQLEKDTNKQGKRGRDWVEDRNWNRPKQDQRQRKR